MPGKYKVLDDALYAFCMAFARHIDELLPNTLITFAVLVMVLGIQLSLGEMYHIVSGVTDTNETLWNEIVFEYIRTSTRVVSFVVISSFLSFSSERFELRQENFKGESIIIPLTFIFVGIAAAKYLAVENKLKTI